MSQTEAVNHSYGKRDLQLENEWMPTDTRKKLEARLAEYRIADNHQAYYADVSEAIHRFPKDPHLYVLRAIELIYLGQPMQAIDDLNCALNLSPNKETLVKIYITLGICYRMMEDGTQAVECYAKAANLGSDFALGVISAMIDIDPNQPIPSEKKLFPQ